MKRQFTATAAIGFIGFLGVGCGSGDKAKVVFFPSASPHIAFKISKDTGPFSVGPLTGAVSPDGKHISLDITVKNIGSRAAEDIEISHNFLIKPFSEDPDHPRPFRPLTSEYKVPALEAGMPLTYRTLFVLDEGDLSTGGASDLIFDFSKCTIAHR